MHTHIHIYPHTHIHTLALSLSHIHTYTHAHTNADELESRIARRARSEAQGHQWHALMRDSDLPHSPQRGGGGGGGGGSGGRSTRGGGGVAVSSGIGATAGGSLHAFPPDVATKLEHIINFRVQQTQAGGPQGLPPLPSTSHGQYGGY
jgi:hypothetical protein